MKSLDEVKVPEELRYTDEHVWIRREKDGRYTVGISDFAQDQLGEVAFIDLPEKGGRFEEHEEFGTVESVKSVSALYMPVAGTVMAVNSALEETPTLLNADCYARGWICQIEPDEESRCAELLDSAQYSALLRSKA